ncbi:MAG TPA: hypothetical protein VGJ01_08340 [Pseudolabrys sp.]|jgi:hypothetical protein
MPNFVIPGGAEGVNPESSCKHGVSFWIPGSLASRAPRNDAEQPAEGAQ